jgi:sporulation protein YlmC with PRC-barrel domain
MHRLMAATAISLALALSAAAQTTTQTGPAPQSANQPQFYNAVPDDHRASKLIGMSVTNNVGESIGDINEILLSKEGKVVAVVIGVGGFLGMGEREIAVSFDSLKLTRDSNGKTATMLPNATKNSLKTAPEWKSPTKS